MASLSSLNAFHHSRSNSFPSRPHPVISQLEENLHSLRISSETTCSSSLAISQKLDGLQDLHECVDGLLSLPLVQQAFTSKAHETREDELLEGSLMLLELCSMAKTGLLQTREALLELQSSIRRGKGKVDETAVRKYLRIRRSVQKAMKSGKDNSAPLLVRKEGESEVFIGLLTEVEAATVSVFESVFRFISGPVRTRSIISKLLLKKRVASEEEKVGVNELAKQDIELESMIGHGTRKAFDQMQIERLLDGLKNLDFDIQGLEEGLESLYRRLIKSRVSLLNSLNQ